MRECIHVPVMLRFVSTMTREADVDGMAGEVPTMTRLKVAQAIMGQQIRKRERCPRELDPPNVSIPGRE